MEGPLFYFRSQKAPKLPPPTVNPCTVGGTSLDVMAHPRPH